MRYEEIEKVAPWCALNRIFGFTPKTGLAIIRKYGSAEAVFEAGPEKIARDIGHSSQYVSKVNADAVHQAYYELSKIKSDGCNFICIDDERYPKKLKECDDPPIGLYYKGTTPIEDIFSRPAVAIVGTRDMTSYGAEWCTRIISSLAKAKIKPLIISGLAIGIDITAHIAALDKGLPTVAVMATGIDAVYPFRHGVAADRIASSSGSCLLTDYPLGTTPQAINFLRRNRIIAGLSSGVILIESKKKGGGLMTCHLASSYNRDVFALPGRIDDKCSEGCNILIHDKIAESIISPDELTDALNLGSAGNGNVKDIRSYIYLLYRHQESEEFASKASEIADIIYNNRDIRMEDLCRLTEMNYSEICHIVGRMECDGIVATDILRQCSINPKIM